MGRVFTRRQGSSKILLSVNPHYLDSTFAAFGVDKGSSFVPDVSRFLGKTLTDAACKKPLSNEGYGRFP